MTRQDPVEKTIYLGCIVLLVAAILSPRTESLWEINLLVIGIYFLFAGFAINRIARTKTSSVEWIHTSATLPIVIFLVYIALQLIPIPLPVLKIISPLTASDKLQLHSWVSEFQFSASNLPYGYCIAYNFHTTLLSWLYTLAYAGMFGLTLHVVSSKRQIDIFFFILVVSGDLISIDMLLKMFFSTSQTVSNSHLTSGVLVMLLPLTAGMFLADKAPSERSITNIGGIHERFQQVLGWLSPDTVPFRMCFLSFSGILMIAALISDVDSKGSMISLLFAAIPAAVLTRLRRLPYKVLAIGFIMLTGIFLGIHAKYGIHSFLPLTEYPAAGIGWGNFYHLSSRYLLSANLKTAGINGWLKTFSEIGIIGSLFLTGLIATYLHDFLSTWRQRRDIHASGIGCGILMSIFSAGIWHGISPDGYSPLELLILSAILGTGYAAIHRRGHGYTAFFNYPIQRRSIPGKMQIIICFLIFSVFVIGSAAVLRKESADSSPVGDNNSALVVLLSGLSENPADGIRWFELGNLMKQMDDDPYAYLHRYLPAADKAYDMAVYCRPGDEVLLFQVADYWVWRSRILSDPDPNDPINTNLNQPLTQQQGKRIFQEKFRRLLQLNPALWKKSVDAIWSYFPDDRVVLEIVPDENESLRRDILRHLAQKDSG